MGKPCKRPCEQSTTPMHTACTFFAWAHVVGGILHCRSLHCDQTLCRNRGSKIKTERGNSGVTPPWLHPLPPRQPGHCQLTIRAFLWPGHVPIPLTLDGNQGAGGVPVFQLGPGKPGAEPERERGGLVVKEKEASGQKETIHSKNPRGRLWADKTGRKINPVWVPFNKCHHSQ